MISIIEKLVHTSIFYRKWTIAVCCVVSALIISGTTGVSFKSSYKDFVNPDSPYLTSIYEIEEAYSKNNNILVMLKPADGDVFTREALSAIEEFTEKAWQLPFSKRVDSITNFQHTQVEGDELIVGDLIEGSSHFTDEQLSVVKQTALSQIELNGFLINEGGTATGINIEFEVDEGDPLKLREIVDAVEVLIADAKQNNSDLRFYSTGLVSLLDGWNVAAAWDIFVIFPIVLLTIFLGLIWFFGSISATLMTVLVTALSAVCAVGGLGHLGGVLLPMTVSGLIMVLILAVADAVHILSTVGKQLEQGLSKNAAINKAIVFNFRAIALTSITTAIGFFSFNSSQFDAIKSLGNMVAFGVLAAFFLSVTLLPALLSYCHLKPSKQRINGQRYKQAASLVLRHRILILLATVPMILISVWLAQQNELDDGMSSFMVERTQFRKDMSEIEDSLTGSASLLYNIKTDQSGVVSDPAFMLKVDALATWFRQQEHVRYVNSYTDTLRRLNRDLNFGDESFEKLPEDGDLAAQYLLLYEMSLPYGLDLTNRINLEKSGTLLKVVTNDLSISEYTVLNAKATTWMQQNGFKDVYETSGAVYVIGQVVAINFLEMMMGALLALAVIAVILVFSLRSILAGFICVIGIVAPILVAFAIWALIDGTVGLGAAIVVSMVIGITVDDSVHFMSKYLHARKDFGQSQEQAIYYAFENVGEALLVNSVALGAGFTIMAMSSFSVFVIMGVLTTITIVLALFANTTLVPALLMMRIDKSKRFFITF